MEQAGGESLRCGSWRPGPVGTRPGRWDADGPAPHAVRRPTSTRCAVEPAARRRATRRPLRSVRSAAAGIHSGPSAGLPRSATLRRLPRRSRSRPLAHARIARHVHVDGAFLAQRFSTFHGAWTPYREP